MMRTPPPLPSDRSFGFTFVVVLALIAGWLWWTGRGGAGIAAAAGVLLLAISLVRPGLLRPANRAWMSFGTLLHRIVSPIVLGLIYFLVITPVALGMRLRGRDALKRRFEPDRPSYWEPRDPPGPPPGSLTNQF